MKTHSFSRLHQALLVAGSFSCGGLTSVLANAEDETAVSKLPTITVAAQSEQTMPYQQKLNLTGFSRKSIDEIPASIGIVTAERIADQHAKTLTDIVKNEAAAGDGYAPIGYYANFITVSYTHLTLPTNREV